MSELPTREEILERKANVMRSRLLRAIDTLDRKRKGKTVRRAAIAGGIAATCAIAGAVAFALSAPKRTRSPWIVIHPKPPSLAAKVAERFLVGFAAVAASEGGRWLFRRLLPRAPPERAP